MSATLRFWLLIVALVGIVGHGDVVGTVARGVPLLWVLAVAVAAHLLCPPGDLDLLAVRAEVQRVRQTRPVRGDQQ